MKKYNKNGMPNALNIQYQASEHGVKLKRKRFKPDFMTKYKLTYAQIADMFGYLNANSFYNASRRQDIMNGVEELIQLIEKENQS